MTAYEADKDISMRSKIFVDCEITLTTLKKK